jgi:magnesium transporter
MNFDVMPELRWQYGYFLILGMMAVTCGLLWFNFRRLGWL